VCALPLVGVVVVIIDSGLNLLVERSDPFVVFNEYVVTLPLHVDLLEVLAPLVGHDMRVCLIHLLQHCVRNGWLPLRDGVFGAVDEEPDPSRQH
jgi:hypothetical protein